MFWELAAVLAGLVVLTVASDHFVIGASRLAGALGVSPIIIGAIVIGFGTSAPEMVVSVIAAVQGSPDIAVSNAAGSNIANLTLVLGTAALITPIAVHAGALRREAPLSSISVLVFGVVIFLGVPQPLGAALLVGLVVVLAIMVRGERKGGPQVAEVEELLDTDAGHPLPQEILRTLLGLAGTVAGAQLLVMGARDLATRAGLAEGFVGLTLVAVGTSLPELATAIQAARRGEPDLIVGNVLGSNIFNSLAVGGAAAIASSAALVDFRVIAVASGVMIGVAFLAWGLLRSDRALHRWEGVLLLGVYLASVVVTALV